MNAAKNIKLDLAQKGAPEPLRETAVAGDINSRSIVVTLEENGKPWIVPEGAEPSVEFRTEWGADGWYNVMPDGSAACAVEENRVTVRLRPEVTAEPGFVWLAVVLTDGELNRLSTFEFQMVVDPGVSGGEPLGDAAYQVRNLDQLNAALEELDRRVDGVDTAQNLTASREAREAAGLAKEYAEQVDPEALNARIDRKGDDVYVDPDSGKLYLVSEGNVIGDGVELPEGGSGLAFDSGYVDGENLLHLTLGGEDIGGFTPFQIPAGSGGGYGSTMKLTTTLASRVFSVLDRTGVCEIPYSWSSVDSVSQETTGAGTAEWTVGGSLVSTRTVEQGELMFDAFPYLTAGEVNDLVLKITDAYGNSRSLSFVVTVTSFGLSWTLGETGIYQGEALTLRMTPTGAGEKTVKVSVDGEVVSETIVTTTGRTVTVEVPAQSHGAHTVKAWVEVTVDGEVLSTEPLVHLGVWLEDGDEHAVVAVLTPEVTVGQYGTAQIRWFVVDPGSETASVVLKVGQETAATLENVGREVQVWAYKANLAAGVYDLSIECGNWVDDITLTVTELGYDIAPVTAGLTLDLDPAGHSNSEANKTDFGYTDGDGVNHPLTFSENFDWLSGGFQADAEGVTAFVVKRGCSVTLDTSLFGEECRKTGKNIKLIFKSENVRNYDAELMSCKSGNVGLVVQAQQAVLTSELETMRVPYYEGRKIEMDLCIEAESENSFAYISLKGVPSCPPVRYGSTDSWAQTSPAVLTIGSEDADVWVYRLKMYGNSLNRYEVLDNFIADAADPGEMVARFERNDIFNTDGSISRTKLSAKNSGLRVIHLKAGRMTTGKKDEVTADLEMVYGDGGERHHLTAQGVTFKAQGTSSLEYILAALNLDVDFGGAASWTNGLGETVAEYAMTENSIPVTYFNLKANVASSESANNVCLADDYNSFNPYICAPKAADGRVRDTVEGHPCAVFFTNTSDAAIEVGARTVAAGETILYFAGDMNNSKKNYAVFGQDNGKWPMQCCVEVMNNTEEPCRFLASDFDNEPWKDGNFEFRYPEEPTHGMKDAFIEMQTWVVSTARDRATGEALAEAVTYGGVTYDADTAQYRAAKFTAEFENYFVRDQMLFHYLFTERHCMTDNRAKNLFLCYEYVEDLKEYRWSVRCDYDNDTAEGCDNSGGATFRYGIEDTDMVGSSYAFNAHDSVLWCNIRDLLADDLKELYNAMKGSGAWDAERIITKFNDYQDITPEAVRIEDMWNKYFLPWISKDASAYALKCHGDKEYWREQFERYQQIYTDSKYCDVTDRSNAISMRATVEKAENGNVTITTYSDMYIIVMYGNGGTVAKRVRRNTPTLIECPTDSLGDTETYIFLASQLTAVSSLAELKPKFVIATTAQRLRELIVGSGEVGYENLNLNQIGVGNNAMLEKLDLQGCPNLVTALDLGALSSLEEFYANGSGITGVTFAKGAPLRIARLPGVASLVARDLAEIETFVAAGENLLTLWVENCPGIDTLSLCKAAEGLVRGRLTDVDWTDDNADVLVRLVGLKGLDAQGEAAERFVLTGKAYCTVITQEELDAIAEAFPELELTYGSMVESHTVTFQNEDGTVLNVQTVRDGSDAKNPVAAGWIKTPAKAPTVEQVFAYAGWDKVLTNITEDTVITAVYTASDRYYTVRVWSDNAESVPLQEGTVIAHGDFEYTAAEPTAEGQVWMGWDRSMKDVTADLDIHAVFITPVLPDSIPAEFDYLYSDDPADNSAYTLAQLMGILENRAGKTYFQVGDRFRLLPGDNEVYSDAEFVLEVLGYDHFRLADGSGEFAHVVVGMTGTMNVGVSMFASYTDTVGWDGCLVRPYLNDQVYGTLPLHWQKLIKQVQVLASEGKQSAGILTSVDRLFLLSAAEVGFDAGTVPYVNEVDPEAEELTFSCFTNNASRIKKAFNGTGDTRLWWTRSAWSGSGSHYRCVGESGELTTIITHSACYISFCFCM